MAALQPPFCSLQMNLNCLRQKIEPEPGQARLLLTDAGGYRLQP